MRAHEGMTLGELAGRFETKGHTNRACKAKERATQCATQALGIAFKVSGRWVCAYCARKAAINQEQEG